MPCVHVMPRCRVLYAALALLAGLAIRPAAAAPAVSLADAGVAPDAAGLPYIAVRDLLGVEPRPNVDYTVRIDLARVPLRLHDSTGGAGGSQSPQPDVYRNLLGVLASGRLDLIVGDDSMVDYSELTLSYTLPSAPPGDLDGDLAVDRHDLDLILAALGTDATAGGDPRDLDHDGRITVLDARKLALLCNKPLCAR